MIKWVMLSAIGHALVLYGWFMFDTVKGIYEGGGLFIAAFVLFIMVAFPVYFLVLIPLSAGR